MTRDRLRAEGLGVTFNPGEPGEVTAFRDIAFELRDGEILAIVGPSGCGKSTLFNVIAGLLKPTAGRVEVDGVPVTDAKGHVGYMLQKDMLLPWRSVLDNVAIGLEVRGVSKAVRHAAARKLIAEFGLGGFENAKPATLSGGMRQRVAFMRTLVFEPEVILLDEPFSALDYQTRVQLQTEFVRIIQEHRRSAILVTHDVPEALVMADRVIVLTPRPGRIRRIYDIDIPRDARKRSGFEMDQRLQAIGAAIWEDLQRPG